MPVNSYCRVFGDLLRGLLAEKDLGVREFGKLVEIDPGYLSGILSGKRFPPLNKIPVWTDQLGLKGEQKQRFQEVAYLTHCPQNSCDLVDALKTEVKRLKLRLGDA